MLRDTLPRVKLEYAVTFFIFGSEPLRVELITRFIVACGRLTLIRLQFVERIKREV